MSATQIKEQTSLSWFVPSDIDDYGLDPYEFRIYARIVRRAGRGEAWESVTKMAKACLMSESRVRQSLLVLEAAGLIESYQRPGYSTVRRLTPRHKWVQSEQLAGIRTSLTQSTPIKSDRGAITDTPIKNTRGVVSKSTGVPLLKVIDEGIPLEVNPNHQIFPPIPPTDTAMVRGEEKEKEKEKELATATSDNASSSLVELSQQLAFLLQKALEPMFASFMQQTRLVFQEIVPSTQHPVATPVNLAKLSKKRKLGGDGFGSQNLRIAQLSTSKERSPTAELSPTETLREHVSPVDSSPSLNDPERTQLLEELSRLVGESGESLRHNTNLQAALNRHRDHIKDALAYFKQAVATWKNKPGLGLFICAVNKGLKPCPTKPGGGWKEWADEAFGRRLVEYSQSWHGDIMLYFVNGTKRLWSEVRNLSWSELEQLACL